MEEFNTGGEGRKGGWGWVKGSAAGGSLDEA
jgi:hypothetical protein